MHRNIDIQSENDVETKEIEERLLINEHYEKGKDADDIDDVENPDLRLFHCTDRYGFMHEAQLSSPDEVEKKLKAIELKREWKWLKMNAYWDQYMQTPKLRKRIHKGIPDKFRGAIWAKLLDLYKLKQLGIYEKLKLQSIFRSEHVKQIDLDINRTYRNHVFFKDRYNIKQKSLFHVLASYSLYNKEVGYCQGMSQIVALLLMYFDEEDAFWALHSLMVKSTHAMHGLFIPGFPKLMRFQQHHDRVLKKLLKSLKKHMDSYEIHSALYTTKWFFQCFLDRVSFNLALRVWDIYMLDGERIMVGMAYNILKMHKKNLLKLNFEQTMDYMQCQLEKDFGYSDDDVIRSLHSCLLELRRAKLDLPPAGLDVEKPKETFGACLLEPFDSSYRVGSVALARRSGSLVQDNAPNSISAPVTPHRDNQPSAGHEVGGKVKDQSEDAGEEVRRGASVNSEDGRPMNQREGSGDNYDNNSGISAEVDGTSNGRRESSSISPQPSHYDVNSPAFSDHQSELRRDDHVRATTANATISTSSGVAHKVSPQLNSPSGSSSISGVSVAMDRRTVNHSHRQWGPGEDTADSIKTRRDYNGEVVGNSNVPFRVSKTFDENHPNVDASTFRGEPGESRVTVVYPIQSAEALKHTKAHEIGFKGPYERYKSSQKDSLSFVPKKVETQIKTGSNFDLDDTPRVGMYYADKVGVNRDKNVLLEEKLVSTAHSGREALSKDRNFYDGGLPSADYSLLRKKDGHEIGRNWESSGTDASGKTLKSFPSFYDNVSSTEYSMPVEVLSPSGNSDVLRRRSNSSKSDIGNILNQSASNNSRFSNFPNESVPQLSSSRSLINRCDNKITIDCDQPTSYSTVDEALEYALTPDGRSYTSNYSRTSKNVSTITLRSSGEYSPGDGSAGSYSQLSDMAADSSADLQAGYKKDFDYDNVVSSPGAQFADPPAVVPMSDSFSSAGKNTVMNRSNISQNSAYTPSFSHSTNSYRPNLSDSNSSYLSSKNSIISAKTLSKRSAISPEVRLDGRESRFEHEPHPTPLGTTLEQMHHDLCGGNLSKPPPFGGKITHTPSNVTFVELPGSVPSPSYWPGRTMDNERVLSGSKNTSGNRAVGVVSPMKSEIQIDRSSYSASSITRDEGFQHGPSLPYSYGSSAYDLGTNRGPAVAEPRNQFRSPLSDTVSPHTVIIPVSSGASHVNVRHRDLPESEQKYTIDLPSLNAKKLALMRQTDI